MKKLLIAILIGFVVVAHSSNPSNYNLPKKDDQNRASQIKEMKFGMFICWSFITFSGNEWTPALDKNASYFRATGCDTEKWCKVA